jgi:hypothetical protein
MAIDYSEKYISELYRSPLMWHIRLLNALFPAVEFIRRAERQVLPPPRIECSGIPRCEITNSLERSATHFQRHGWAFVENILDPDFHQFLKAHWPKRRYFTAPFDLHKAYDKGFRWVERNPAKDRWGALIARDALGDDHPAYMDQHPHVRVVFDYLRSSEFIDRVVAFTGSPARLRFNRFQLTVSYPGTLVAPHRDSQQNAESWVSFIFYISGTGGDSSGGTAILGDNEFRNVIFEPKRLVNTCLIFDPAAPFYHGVRRIAFGKHRWMMSAEYVSGAAEATPKPGPNSKCSATQF